MKDTEGRDERIIAAITRARNAIEQQFIAETKASRVQQATKRMKRARIRFWIALAVSIITAALAVFAFTVSLSDGVGWIPAVALAINTFLYLGLARGERNLIERNKEIIHANQK